MGLVGTQCAFHLAARGLVKDRHTTDMTDDATLVDGYGRQTLLPAPVENGSRKWCQAFFMGHGLGKLLPGCGR